MPIFGLQTSLQSNANTVLAAAFFPRYHKGFWQELCGSTVSTRLVEPLAIPGASPLLRQYRGRVQESAPKSFKMQSPNLLFKAWENIARSDIEYDQTGTILKRTGQVGVRMAAAPDYALAIRIMQGHATTAMTGEDGVSYSCVIDGVPLFSGAHTFDGGATTQSNIITGAHSAALAGWQGYDIGTKVNYLHQNHDALVNQIATLVDDQGALLYPEFDADTDLVYVVPPVMRNAARVAFQQAGATVGGLNGGSSGTTTLPEARGIRKVLSPALIAGCADIFNDSGTVSPTAPTAYYAFITNDYAKPFYYQTFRPPTGSDYLPKGYDPAAVAEQILAGLNTDGQRVSPMAAAAYANAIIDHDLGSIGASATRDVAKREQFFMSPRMRMNIFPGLWTTAFKVAPTGQST